MKEGCRPGRIAVAVAVAVAVAAAVAVAVGPERSGVAARPSARCRAWRRACRRRAAPELGIPLRSGRSERRPRRGSDRAERRPGRTDATSTAATP